MNDALKHGGAEACMRLAEFVAALRFEDLPASVVDKAQVHLRDTLGAALAGTRSREYALVARTIAPQPGGAAPLWGWGAPYRASARDAALVNGVAAHVFELDDTGGCDHSGAVVVPAVFAAAEGRAVSGRDLIVAIVAGYEVGRRLLEACGGYDAHNGVGWHSTGTCGALGAAAAVARLWRFDAARVADAITIATSFAGGLWAFIHDGAQTKKIHAGRAAEGGLLAAQLAREGMRGPSLVFDDVWGGFFRAYDHRAGDVSRFTADLGSPFKILRVSLKPYASCRGTHSAVDALDDVLRETGRDPRDIARIDVRASALLVDMCGKPAIEPLAAAQMSLPLALALRCAQGGTGLSAYAQARRHDPAVADVLGRIVVAIDAAMAPLDEPVLDILFRDGARFERMVPRATGSPERPMTPAMIDAKFGELAGMALDAPSAAAIAQATKRLPDIEDASGLLALMAGGMQPAAPFL